MKITKDELRELYNSLTLAELCEMIGYSTPKSVYRLLKRNGIPLKSGDNRGKRNIVTVIDGV